MVVLMDGQMCVHLLSDEYLAAECGIGKRRSRQRLWALFSWETLDPAIHADVTLTGTNLPKQCCRPFTAFHRNSIPRWL